MTATSASKATRDRSCVDIMYANKHRIKKSAPPVFRREVTNSDFAGRNKKLKDRKYKAPESKWKRKRYGPQKRSLGDNEQDKKFHGYDSDDEDNEVEVIPQETLAEKLHVKDIDLHIDENTSKHRTDMFECTEKRTYNGEELEANLLIRRGEEFEITIEFDRPYNKEEHDMCLCFKTGNSPNRKRKTLATFPLDETGTVKYKPNFWGARIVSRDGNKMTIAVFVPSDCPIGHWKFIVKTIVQGENKGDVEIWEYIWPDDPTILLNPWCKEDEVYMSDTELLNEYVLNDDGVLFQGTFKQIGPKPWYFGQFDNGILDSALHLVRKGFGYKVSSSMGSAVQISRALSKMVNNCDDNGVLAGNWSGKYAGGKSPTSWCGSVKILRQYMTSHKPVKFGQCWVFSGILTTVCRAVGLPCRSITNFASAHDSDTTLTIDKFFDETSDGDLVLDERMTDDSVWNFHLWNEVWMKREDLGDDCDGWQVIDSTPQEKSDGVYCCGPAPVVAIKRGDVLKGFDTPFVFSEVNADLIHWRKTPHAEYEVIKRAPNAIGRCISTHKPTGKPYRGKTIFFGLFGDDEREDVTIQYKHPEGSRRERFAVASAVSTAPKRHSSVDTDPYVTEIETGVVLEIDFDEDVFPGTDFSIKVLAKNSTDQTRVCRVTVKLTATMYTGEPVGNEPFHRERFDVCPIRPGKEKKFTTKVPGEVALRATREGFAMRVDAFADVLVGERQEKVTDEAMYRFRIPELEFDGPSRCKKNEVIEVKVSLKNPLNVSLTNCVLSIEGSLECVSPTDDEMQFPDIKAKETWEATLTVKARGTQRNKKVRELSASFDCKEMPDITGKYSVDVD
ncbi:annulin-like [Gigantopelta aegis]|uniref:annulin-like n=1 Tax=Gigantopelta aegis TaxID=1735272 RepID=UPI001B888FC6|nr:annulin-like [Gigantopelta aegis]